MTLLVDVGNTRIKWATLAGGKLERRGSAVHRGALDAALAELEGQLPKSAPRVIAANVAGDVVAAKLRTLVATRPNSALELVAVSPERFGVRCAYADPKRLGVDRWVAVLAAHHAARGAACVVNAGTAVTFDAVAKDGAHLGGLIFPGAALLAAALDRNTSDIGATPRAGAVPQGLELLGRSTAAAVGNAAWLALAAAIDRAASTVARSLGTRPTVYLAGGDAAALRGWLETPVEERADLVLEGLALFAAPTGEGN